MLRGLELVLRVTWLEGAAQVGPAVALTLADGSLCSPGDVDRTLAPHTHLIRAALLVFGAGLRKPVRTRPLQTPPSQTRLFCFNHRGGRRAAGGPHQIRWYAGEALGAVDVIGAVLLVPAVLVHHALLKPKKTGTHTHKLSVKDRRRGAVELA